MTGLLIGYARVSTDEQDLTAQRDGLAALGVPPERIYVDHGPKIGSAGVTRYARSAQRRVDKSSLLLWPPTTSTPTNSLRTPSTRWGTWSIT